MKNENMIWMIIFVIGVVLLGARLMFVPDMGRVYVSEEITQFVNLGTADEPNWTATDKVPDGTNLSQYPEDERIALTKASTEPYVAYRADLDAGGSNIRFSLTRTIGLWLAAFFTLFVLSFLIKDNPFYKIAESVFIGVSAAYWMVVAWWDTLVPNLVGKLAPDLVRSWAMPGLGDDEHFEAIYIVPCVLGVMLLCRLLPKGGWISRWPMAFFIGTFCGLRLVRFMQADFLSQIRNSIVPLWVPGDTTAATLGSSISNIILLVGILTCLVYFFFSIEHKGVVGHTARVGIWFLMITFGAAFGYTVMGRIALLAIRIEFLFDDWLWLIDPNKAHEIVEATGVLMTLGIM